MVHRSDELSREIAETRQEMGERLIELRRRGRRAARRSIQIAIVAGALGGAAILGLLAYRMTRPPTLGERVGRVLPAGRLSRRLARLNIPSLRLYVNDRSVREDEETATQRLALTAARAFGTAAATAAMGMLLRRLAGRDKAKS